MISWRQDPRKCEDYGPCDLFTHRPGGILAFILITENSPPPFPASWGQTYYLGLAILLLKLLSKLAGPGAISTLSGDLAYHCCAPLGKKLQFNF